MCGKKSGVRKKKEKEKEKSVGKINKTPTPNPSAKETINHLLSPSYILSLSLSVGWINRKTYLVPLYHQSTSTHRLSQTHTHTHKVQK